MTAGINRLVMTQNGANTAGNNHRRVIMTTCQTHGATGFTNLMDLAFGRDRLQVGERQLQLDLLATSRAGRNRFEEVAEDRPSQREQPGIALADGEVPGQQALEVGDGPAAADQPEVHLAGVRQDRDVEGLALHRDGERVGAAQSRAVPVADLGRSGDVGDRQVGRTRLA